MHVIHFSAECYPVAKVGGLADVLGALPKYQQKQGLKSEVVIPYYEKPFLTGQAFDVYYEGELKQGGRSFSYTVLKESNDVLGFPLYVIKIPGLLDRVEVYGYLDESEQFLAFQSAALDWLCEKKIRPDVLHCHDHHTGLIPFYVEHVPRFRFLAGTATVATIHNAQYQGWMEWSMAALIPPFDTWKWGLLDWGGVINPLASLIKCAWAYTTVSTGYLKELYVSANGLERLLEAEKAKAHGIINGIDPDVWDPERDVYLKHPYNSSTVDEGKLSNKEVICGQFNLNSDLPLFAFIGRFALEKGADILAPSIAYFLERHAGQANFLVLGSGDPNVTTALERLYDKNSQHFALYVGYNEELAHQIYAAADFLVMPSRVEPCGLNQLYAMRYGTVPVVNSTGGLRDTVIDLAIPNGYGITCDASTTEATIKGMERAIGLYKLKKEKDGLRRHLMNLNFSWDRSAKEYVDLYKYLTQKL